MADTAVVAFRNQNVRFNLPGFIMLPEFGAVENVEMPMRIARSAG
jgi:predicted ABC-type transport system involved in lysophospholipase L1 biosynthesis ATPase subunit